ncbi:MAG: serine/threonine protein kinase [Candidatus Hydrogenedentes bacterium]|nr:serine/threonine protein kinase [Candidatus Hydrogenedentota bacterium]
MAEATGTERQGKVAEQSIPARLGRYEILRELGKGAMGVVYEGRDPNIGRRVAIKTARRDVMAASGRAEEMMERFLREARAAGALNHPNIITIYDSDEEDGIAYIAMEFLEGTDLFHVISEKRRFGPEQIVEIAATICRALAEAHGHGIVHRDIKPSNIIMLPNSVIKVADFGIAHVTDSNLTQEGSMVGTPHYMSPEQFMAQKVDGRSDLFSAGIIIYELLTGEKPFPGESLSAVMHSVLRQTPIAPRELNFAVSECLSRVIMKSLNKDPKQRYQTGEAMAAALEESLKDNPDPAIVMVPVGDAQEAVQATVVTGGAGMAATVLTAAPPAGASLAAAVAQTVAKPGTASIAVPDNVAGGVVAAPKFGGRRIPLKAVGVASGLMVLLAVIAGFYFLGGGETGATPDKYYSKAYFHVWTYVGPDLNAVANLRAVSATEKDPSENALFKQLKGRNELVPGSARITISYPLNTGFEPDKPIEVPSAGTKSHDLERRASSFTYKAVGAKDTEGPLDIPAASTRGQSTHIYIFLQG